MTPRPPDDENEMGVLILALVVLLLATAGLPLLLTVSH